MSPDRMNPLDVWFLHVENDVNHMHIGSVGIFEGPVPGYPRVLDLIERKLPLVPRYRQRVTRVPLDLARPVWVDDPHFSLQYHVRHTALPAPGDSEQLRALASRIMSQPLDRARPLWELWMVEGYGDDRWAAVSKVHHAMVDGVAGTDLLAMILGVEPEPELPAWEPWQPDAAPSRARLVRDAVAEPLTNVAELGRVARARVRPLRKAVRTVTRNLRGGAELAGLFRLTPPSSLNGPIGPHRRWAWAGADFIDVERIREAYGGTVNDVVLTAITRGFRDLLQARRELSRRNTVRSLVPVSVRHADEHGNLDNRVAALFADLPVAIADPVQRFLAVQNELGRLKRSGERSATELLISLSGWAPPAALGLGMRTATRFAQQVGQRAVNTVTTNVPGPPLPLYLLGRRMVEAYPFVPIAEGVRIGIAIFSYEGRITFGVTGDYDTTSDLDLLTHGIEDGVLELVQAAEHRGALAPPEPEAAARKATL